LDDIVELGLELPSVFGCFEIHGSSLLATGFLEKNKHKMKDMT
jgi:hypothetical protein